MSSPVARRLTTTSYAILGLLAIKPWSTYELTKQMRRTFSHIWPRAESNVYAEPKRLVEAGLARAETQSVGRRPRTLYLITDEGLRALGQWVGTSSGPSHYESETLVKVLFGNHGSRDELLANLHAFHAEATAVLAQWATVAEDYDRGTQSFPDRAHVNALIFRLVWDQASPQRSVGDVGDRTRSTMARYARSGRP